MSEIDLPSIRKVVEQLKLLAKKHDYGDPITWRNDTWQMWCYRHQAWE